MDLPEKIKTGISGLDSMLFGGVPAYNQVLIAGGPGAGKTLMSFEILYHNAKAGIPGAFIALEEKPDVLLKNVKQAFGKYNDIDKLIKDQLIVIDGEDPATRLQSQSDSATYSFGNIVADIEGVIKQNNAKCVVIDSISLLRLMLADKFNYRRSMLLLTSNLRRLNVTSFLTVEIDFSDREKLRYSPEFFIFDGIIMLYQLGKEDRRTLTAEIVKMRGSDHSWALAPYEITENGFNVYTVEQIGEIP